MTDTVNNLRTMCAGLRKCLMYDKKVSHNKSCFFWLQNLIRRKTKETKILSNVVQLSFFTWQGLIFSSVMLCLAWRWQLQISLLFFFMNINYQAWHQVKMKRYWNKYKQICWSANSGVFMCRSPLDDNAYVFVNTFPAVLSISWSFYLDCLWDIDIAIFIIILWTRQSCLLD